MTEIFVLNINDNNHKIECEPDTPLVYILRNDLKLKGTKFGCGDGVCGACTVISDGKAIFSCDTPVWSIKDKKIQTIEGISSDSKLHPIQESLINEQGGQCGYCLSGIIMRAKAFIESNPKSNISDIANDLDRNLCRCGSQSRILRALEKVGIIDIEVSK